MEDDHLIHIPREDYIPRKKWNQQIFAAFAVPSCIALLTAGGVIYQVKAQGKEIEKKASKNEVLHVEETLSKDIDYLKEGQRDLKKQVEDNHKEIIELLKNS